MSCRATFALDTVAIERLKNLAERWNVSQAEVVRRALELAERSDEAKAVQPGKLLEAYYAEGGLAKELAEPYLADLYKDRAEWRE